MISITEFNILITNTLGIETASTVLAMTLAFSPDAEDITKQTQSFINDELSTEEIAQYKTSLLESIAPALLNDLRRQLDESFERMQSDNELSNTLKNDVEFIKGDSLVETLNLVTPKGISKLTNSIDNDELTIAILAFIVNDEFQKSVESINAWAASMDPEKKAQRKILQKKLEIEQEIEQAFREGDKETINALLNEDNLKEGEHSKLKNRLLDSAVDSNKSEAITTFFEFFPEFISHDESATWVNAIKRCLDNKQYDLLATLIANKGHGDKLHNLLQTLINNHDYEPATENDIEAITHLLTLTPSFDLFKHDSSATNYQLNEMIKNDDNLLLKTLLSYENILPRLAEKNSFPIRSAVENLNIDAFLILESFGAEITIPSSLSPKYTLLGGIVATSGDETNPKKLAIINLLLDRGLKIAFDNERTTENSLARFYAGGRDNFSQFDAYALLQLDNSKDLELIKAIKTDDSATIKSLLTENDDLFDINYTRITPPPIEVAISFASVDVFENINTLYPLNERIPPNDWDTHIKHLVMRGDIQLIDFIVNTVEALTPDMIELDAHTIQSLVSNKLDFINALAKKYPELSITENHDTAPPILVSIIPTKDLDMVKFFINKGADKNINYEGIPLLYRAASTYSLDYFNAIYDTRLIRDNGADNEQRSILAYVIESKSDYSQDDQFFIDALIDNYSFSIINPNNIPMTLRVANHYMQAASVEPQVVIDKFALLNFIESTLYGATVNSKTELLVTLFENYDDIILNRTLTALLQKYENTTRLVLKAAKQANVSDSIIQHLIFDALSSENHPIYETLISLGYDINQPLSNFNHSFTLPLPYDELTYLGAFILKNDTFTSDQMQFIQRVGNDGGTITVTNTPGSISQSILRKLSDSKSISDKKASEILHINIFEEAMIGDATEK